MYALLSKNTYPEIIRSKPNLKDRALLKMTVPNHNLGSTIQSSTNIQQQSNRYGTLGVDNKIGGPAKTTFLVMLSLILAIQTLKLAVCLALHPVLVQKSELL